jgi:precorrin-4/cobalt-precorrin-4 C11-methyltransferase
MSATAAAVGWELTGEPEWRPFTVTPRQQAAEVAARGELIAVYMAGKDGAALQDELLRAGLQPTTPCTIGHCVSWPEGSVTTCALQILGERLKALDSDRLTLVLVRPQLSDSDT